VTSNQPRARYWLRWTGDSQSHNSASARSPAWRRRSSASRKRRTGVARPGTSTSATAAAAPASHQVAALIAERASRQPAAGRRTARCAPGGSKSPGAPVRHCRPGSAGTPAAHSPAPAGRAPRSPGRSPGRRCPRCGWCRPRGRRRAWCQSFAAPPPTALTRDPLRPIAGRPSWRPCINASCRLILRVLRAWWKAVPGAQEPGPLWWPRPGWSRSRVPRRSLAPLGGCQPPPHGPGGAQPGAGAAAASVVHPRFRARSRARDLLAAQVADAAATALQRAWSRPQARRSTSSSTRSASSISSWALTCGRTWGKARSTKARMRAGA
jgi:hypothetical protein